MAERAVEIQLMSDDWWVMTVYEDGHFVITVDPQGHQVLSSPPRMAWQLGDAIIKARRTLTGPEVVNVVKL